MALQFGSDRTINNGGSTTVPNDSLLGSAEMASFLLVLAAVATLLVAYAFWPAAQPAKPSPPRLGRSTRPPANTGGDVSAQPEAAALLNAYPGLKQIGQLPAVPEGSPKLVEQLSPDTIAAVQERVAGIQPIPVDYLRLLRLLGNPQSASTEIVTLASTNPVLSARILRTVNSPFFGRPQKITSVGRGITLLGYNNVRMLVLRESLNATMPSGDSGLVEQCNKIWIHSAAVSACAAHVGTMLFNFPDYELGTIGLLHDIGKYFIHLLPAAPEIPKTLPTVLQEDATFGINHAALGSLIGENWRLSQSTVKAIEYHHHPLFVPPGGIPSSCLRQSFVVCLSDLMCKSLGYAAQDDHERWAIRPEYFDLFKLSPDLHGLITARLLREIDKANVTVQSYVADS